METCALLTTKANELLAPHHGRVPVILRPEEYGVWLDAGVRRDELLMPLLRPYPHEGMSAYAVSPLVNSPSNGGPRCVEPLPGRAGAAGRITNRGGGVEGRK